MFEGGVDLLVIIGGYLKKVLIFPIVDKEHEMRVVFANVIKQRSHGLEVSSDKMRVEFGIERELNLHGQGFVVLLSAVTFLLKGHFQRLNLFPDTFETLMDFIGGWAIKHPGRQVAFFDGLEL